MLAIAQREEIPQTTISAIGRAAKHWRSGDKALAAIHLAQIGLRKIDEQDGERLRLAAALLDAGMSADALARELGLNIQLRARKYAENQPRVPAGSGRASGQWSSGDAAGGETNAPLVERRSASGGVNHVHGVPPDAIVVTRPNGAVVNNPDSPTGKLMAPPWANFQEIYAAGKAISVKWPWDQYAPGGAALGHFGTYDFQRDKATNTFYDAYIAAANYAVGVYMAGAKYSLSDTHIIAETYALKNSKNALTYSDRQWIAKGWEDADRGLWR